MKIDTVVAIDDSHTVASMPVKLSNSSTIDTYWYVDKQGTDWKITAMRAVAFNDVNQNTLDILKKVPHPNNIQKEQIANIELALSSDEQLKAWFLLHAPDMERLKTVLSPCANGVTIRNQEAAQNQRAEPVQPGDAQAREVLVRLHLCTVDKSAQFIKVSIGGMYNNSVGFIYCLEDKPPKISRYKFIWVEHIFGQWYLFKAVTFV